MTNTWKPPNASFVCYSIGHNQMATIYTNADSITEQSNYASSERRISTNRLARKIVSRNELGYEGLRNAFRHANAKRIEVEIGYDQRRLRACVRDDGKGIDPKSLSADGREGHFGLRGMRERAKLIGGQLTVWSELDSGTEVELSIPAGRAYATSTKGLRSWFAKKGSRTTVE